jgi:hypothetical protein
MLKITKKIKIGCFNKKNLKKKVGRIAAYCGRRA